MYWEDTFRSRTLSHPSGKKQLFPKKKSSRTVPRKIFLLALFLLSQAIFYRCDLFRLKEVEVTGNAKTRTAAVLKAAAFPMEKNLFEVSLKDVDGKLKKLHWIKSVTVEKRYPASLRLCVTERRPVVLVTTRDGDGTLFSVDSEGMILERSPGDRAPQALPLLEVRDRLQVARRISPKKVRAGLACHEWLPGQERPRVTSVFVNAKLLITLNYRFLGRSTSVSLGEEENLTPRTARIFSALIKWCEDKGRPVKYINMKYPDKPALLWYDGESETAPALEIRS